mgnify:CR=1 FL=1
MVVMARGDFFIFKDSIFSKFNSLSINDNSFLNIASFSKSKKIIIQNVNSLLLSGIDQSSSVILNQDFSKTAESENEKDNISEVSL